MTKCLNHNWAATVYGSICTGCGIVQDRHIMPICEFQPLQDCILIRECNLGKRGDIALPDNAMMGKLLVVVAVGPDVTNGLVVGDTVLVVGNVGDDYYPLPDCKDLMVFRQKNVVLKTGHVDESIKYRKKSPLEV